MNSRVGYYFAYGSNMNPQRVARRGLRTAGAALGELADFRLEFNKASRDHPGFGHANIEYERGRVVEGVLYELAAPGEILKMDPFERAPWNYGREVVQVASGQQTVWAWTYFANPAVKRPGLTPPAEYLQHLLAGEPWLSEAYFRHLLSFQD